MTEIKAELLDIRERLLRLEGRVSRIPSYGGIAVIVGVIVALSTLVQVAVGLTLPAP